MMSLFGRNALIFRKGSQEIRALHGRIGNLTALMLVLAFVPAMLFPIAHGIITSMPMLTRRRGLGLLWLLRTCMSLGKGIQRWAVLPAT